MSRLSQEEVMAAFQERTLLGPVNWEYAGNRWDYAYLLPFPDLSFLIRAALSGKALSLALKMMDSDGETLGFVFGDSAEPEPSYYSALSDIFLSARRQAGNPLMEETPETSRQF